LNLRTLIAVVLLVPGSAGAGAGSTPDSPDALDCVINPSVVADLGSGSAGVISAVHVDRSDVIQAGDLLAELDSGVERAAMALARSRAEKETEVELRRVNAAFGRRQLERSQDLFRRQVVSTNDIDQRKTEAELARIELRQALDNRELSTLELERARQVVERRRIHSPISGVVMERFKTVGEYVDEQPVLRVARLDPLHVEVFVPVERLGAVMPGMQAQVWSDVSAGEAWEARVSRVDPVADIASATYGVRLELANPDHQIPAGLRCRLRFQALPETIPETQAGALAQPNDGGADAAGGSPPGAPVVHSDHGPGVTVDTVPGSTSELASVATPATGESSSQAATLTQACLRSEGLVDRERAVRLIDRLAAAGLEARLIEEDNVTASGFSARSALLDERAAADTLIATLRRHGIEDFVVHRQHGGYRVALGVYRTAEAAQRRVEQLAAIGVTAERDPWNRTAPRYAVVVSEPDAAGTDQSIADIGAWAGLSIRPSSACGQLASR
jgi:RND family efflux transporter MFP subunit